MKKNAGQEAASKAAQASGAATVLPPFAEHEHGSDWNDLAKLKGREAWQQIWRAGIEVAKLEIRAGQEGRPEPDRAEEERRQSLLAKVIRAVKR